MLIFEYIYLYTYVFKSGPLCAIIKIYFHTLKHVKSYKKLFIQDSFLEPDTLSSFLFSFVFSIILITLRDK